MMKITKKLITLVLAAMLLLSLAVPAMAADSDFLIQTDDESEDYQVWLVGYLGPGGDVVIPDTVTHIGNHSFYEQNSVTSVTIPSSVTEISIRAFACCNNLKSVIIPSSVTIIYEYAFAFCPSLTDVYFGGTEAQWKGYIDANADMLLGPMFDEETEAHVTIHYNSTGPNASTTPEQPTTPTTPKVQLSSQPLTVDGKAVSAQAYNIGGSNFFKLRDVAMMLNGTSKQFSVGYDNATRTVTATSGQAYTATGGELTAGADMSASCVVSDQPIIVNGKKLDVTVYNIGGSNYFMLRDLGSALGFGVDYDNATRTVLVTTK